MPIDTRQKRASAALLLQSWVLSPVAPDATLDQGDRQHASWIYAGVLAGEPYAVAEAAVDTFRSPVRVAKPMSQRVRR